MNNKAIICALLLLIPGFSTVSAQGIVVNRHSVSAFDSIPAQYKSQASALRMMFMDRSVGANIDDGLKCLSYPHASAPNHCTRYIHTGVPPYSTDSSEVSWAGQWDNSNWQYRFWEENCSEWYKKAGCFIDYAEARIDSFDVLGFQMSYLEVTDQSMIADPVSGFFGTDTTVGNADMLIDFMASHPGKKVIWFTSSLARGIGSTVSQSFNDQMRAYTSSNNLILFDVADILSHTPSGVPCYDNRDGIPYSFGNNSENHPDDSLDIPAICQEYTTEVEGGHLGSVSAGKIRVAKAFWVLMAYIAGWNPIVSIDEENNNNLSKPALTLYQNYPNPFTEETTLSWQSSESGHTRIILFDKTGRAVRTIDQGSKPPGLHKLVLNTAGLAPGVYFCRLQTGNCISQNKLIIMNRN